MTVAVWLWLVAALVFAMVVVGGATRLTGSGLSITEWKPLIGALPPLSQSDWDLLFAKYQAIPQFKLVNPDMTLEGFRQIFWWEWGHRLLGRLVGLAFAGPLLIFWLTRTLPQRLKVPCLVLLVLGGLQGLIGWWMVASGLSERISVAPERLMTHLGLALILMSALIWTALSAGGGSRRHRHSQGADQPWWWLIWAAVLFQCLLGALVAGNDAGTVLTDWPLMDGQIVPRDYIQGGLWSTLAHSKSAVQFNHRVMAYILVGIMLWLAAQTLRRTDSSPARRGWVMLFVVSLLAQAMLGIATLMQAVPVGLGVAHQALAAWTLGVAACLAWVAGGQFARR